MAKQKQKPLPSQSDLQRDFTYYPATGLFVRHKPSHSRENNTRINLSKGYCGSTSKKGYITMSYNNRTYQAHRLIWKYMTGKDPEIMDHINGDRFDNRWRNLRNVDATLNSRNVRSTRDFQQEEPFTKEMEDSGYTSRHRKLPPPSPESQPTIYVNIHTNEVTIINRKEDNQT